MVVAFEALGMPPHVFRETSPREVRLLLEARESKRMPKVPDF